jgi:hypothetical protein
MSHQSVRFLLRDVSNSLADNIEFKGGRDSEFNNLIANKAYKSNYRWLLPMSGTKSNFSTNQTRVTIWTIAINFLKLDDFDASAEETNSLHDIVDLQVDAFLQRLDDWSQTSQDIVGEIVILSIRKSPFYKDQAGIFSGWRLDFQLQVPDDFEYCTPDNIEIYAGNN